MFKYNKTYIKNDLYALGLLISIIIFIVVFLNNTEYYSNTTDLNPSNGIHYCNWEDCDHQGQEMDQFQFTSLWGYEEMTDGWCVEMTHFINPEMTYEECDTYVMSGVE